MKELLNHLEDNKRNIITVMLSTFIFGLITHGEMIFYKISMHDDVGLFYSSCGVKQGRWAGEYYDKIVRFMFGNKFSSPVFSSFFSLFFLALCSFIIIDLLEIKRTISIVAISVISITFPAVTHTFMYMNCAPTFSLAIFLCAISAWLTIKYRFGWGAGILLISISLGLYQAYLGYFIVLMLLWGVHELICNKTDLFWKKVKAGLAASIGGVSLYLIILKFFERVTGVKASYMGMDHMINIDLAGRAHGLIRCYKSYVDILRNAFAPLETTTFFCWIYRVFFLLVIYDLVILIKNSEISVKCIIYTIVCVLLIPVGTNAIYVLGTRETNVVFLTLYPMVLSLIAGIVIDEWKNGIIVEKDTLSTWKTYINSKSVLICLLGFICLNYIYISNATYLKLSFIQEKVISYQTTLVSRIKMTEGYKDEYPVLWVGEQHVVDESIRDSEAWETIKLGYADNNTSGLINNYAWKVFMKEHVGYNPETIGVEEVSDEVKKKIETMPCYPDDGSIQVIDNTVIVRLGEEN